MGKEELRQALALAAGCNSEDVQIGEIGVSKGGLGPAWVKCPAAGGRCPQASSGGQGGLGVVHREGLCHTEEAPAVLQVPGVGARTGNLRIRRG